MQIELGLAIMFTLIGIAILVIYLRTLYIQIKKREFGWFVTTLVMSPVFIVYWLYKLIKNLD